jgi:hypothetical protein
VSIATPFTFILDDDSLLPAPESIFGLAVECRLKGNFNVIITHLTSIIPQSIQAAVTIIKDFASQFTLLQAENIRLQEDAQSKSAQLDQAVKIAATAQ